MRKVSAKMVPRILSDDQKQQQLDVCSNLSRQLAEGNNFLDRVITDDQSWCFQYDVEMKCQSMQWKTSVSPRPKEACTSRTQVKTMLICFFDHKGIVHFEFLEQGRTVNKHCYLEILARLREAVRRRRPELWPVLGSCFMTIPLLMMCSLSRSFWPKIDIEIGPSTIFTRLGPV
jgi:hypothetical protein